MIVKTQVRRMNCSQDDSDTKREKKEIIHMCICVLVIRKMTRFKKKRGKAHRQGSTADPFSEKKTVNSEGNKRREEVNKWSYQRLPCAIPSSAQETPSTHSSYQSTAQLFLFQSHGKKNTQDSARGKKKRLIRDYWLAKKKTETESKK